MQPHVLTILIYDAYTQGHMTPTLFYTLIVARPSIPCTTNVSP